VADPYEVLGVPRDATLEEVRNAHRRAVQLVHPDRHSDARDDVRDEATRRTLELNNARDAILAERGEIAPEEFAVAPGSPAPGPSAPGSPAPGGYPGGSAVDSPYAAAAARFSEPGPAEAGGVAAPPRSRPPGGRGGGPPPSGGGFLSGVSRWRKNPIVDLVITLIAAVAIAYGVQRWVVKPYRIPSQSMERTLHVGDRVLAVRFLYRFHDPHRGDIIVFHPNGIGNTALPGTHVASVTYIKRLIGMPGDWVQATNGHVQICKGPNNEACKTLNEPYVSSTQIKFGPIHVPAGHYFMMGDNREFSDDSRDWGSITKQQIIGRAFMIYWPPTRIRFF
jgi:signal peptidase I